MLEYGLHVIVRHYNVLWNCPPDNISYKIMFKGQTITLLNLSIMKVFSDRTTSVIMSKGHTFMWGNYIVLQTVHVGRFIGQIQLYGRSIKVSWTFKVTSRKFIYIFYNIQWSQYVFKLCMRKMQIQQNFACLSKKKFCVKHFRQIVCTWHDFC